MKRLSVVLFVGIAASASQAQILQSSAVWNSGAGANGHEYRLYAAPVGGFTWEEAQDAALSIGGYLATVTSREENAFIYDTLAIASNNNVWHVDQFNSQIGPWLGGFQLENSPEPSGGWQWVTGEDFSFNAWSPGEPNNSGGTENRLHYFGNPSRTSNWNDITNTVKIEGYVVELVPTPGTAGALVTFGLFAGRRRR